MPTTMVFLGWTVPTLQAQTGNGYDLTWNTIDSGGRMFSTGNGYELGGTIGQPDAGGPLTDVDEVYELTGGFWVEQGVPPPCGSPDSGDDVCSSGGNSGQPCSTNADCPGGACGLKSRYVSITPCNEAVAGGPPTSIQIEIVSMKQCAGGMNAGRGCETNGQCPGSTCANSPNIGDVWWAGAEQSIANSPNPARRGAPLQCTATPNAQAWTTGVLHLWGQAVVPGSSYNVRMCDASGSNCSTPLRVDTGKWGDAIAPFGGGSQPSFADISAVVDKFRNLASAPDTPRVDFVGAGSPGQPNTPNQMASFADVSAAVDAFRTYPYPFTVPACSP